ncbi:MAG TPA: COX15/CtaA family protein [Candidatus Nanopelagicaceae bacterium]|nr:COX15/CtaA family protein [Candidatus Nanopelagicaceae bacterium]
MSQPAQNRAQKAFLALATAQALIVISGGLVRLTGSGLGCPTWPKCTEGSYTPRTSSLHGYHTVIEFSNRLLTFLLIALALAALYFALNESRKRANPGLVGLASIQVGGIFAQAILGGITVLTKLNPLPVAGHFMLSIALITVSLALVVKSRPIEQFAPLRLEIARLNVLLILVAALVLTLGTLVTGSGPHAGDASAKRFPFDPRTVSFLHADVVIAFCGLTLAIWLALRLTHADQPIIDSAQLLIIFILMQGAIGYTQYFTKLPEALVALHLIGADCVWISTYLLFTRIRRAGVLRN